MSTTATTTTTTTPYCFRCLHVPGPNDEALKRCGRCRSRHYCSQQCQSNDWPRHKEGCRILAAEGTGGTGGTVPPRSRTTMRFTMGSFGHPDGIDPDVIYYLKKGRPHIKEVLISGPFYPLQTLYEQMFGSLARERSIEGEQTLNEIIDTGSIAMLQHFNAPTADGNILRFEILREKNAEVARILPGEVWYLLFGILEQKGFLDRNPNLTEMDVRGTFRTCEAANEAAKRALQDLEEGGGPDTVVTRVERDGLACGSVTYREGGKIIVQTVECRHEIWRSHPQDPSLEELTR
ncbi:hypothetical protein LTR20_002661 [Exophiala xenobiotica]|nr:hypothetical protein LTR40_008810 [Exophiala xenobiotica]KAK5390613.1 hypothetical protein LTS13_000696 [Exophiala xenobiotica]KAK5403831.1 hypothetical protein LTR79_000586 [Exophiala xenobiotica]KAK5423320.1 hypothetical protein LTR90_002340 [Exophiala xenobiotica]KAK5438298.1 hypothetical protein LTR18_008820 [Exophiala xenobiotica]